MTEAQREYKRAQFARLYNAKTPEGRAFRAKHNDRQAAWFASLDEAALEARREKNRAANKALRDRKKAEKAAAGTLLPRGRPKKA